jgi:putative transposase
MPYDPLSHHRRSIRLPGYDYTAPGAYFITIATHNRQTIFGEIIDGVIQLNTCGEIARDEWVKTAAIRREIALDEFAIMPNHMHGIIVIDGVRRDTASPCPHGDQPIRIPTIEHFSKPVIGSIPTIIRAYKSAVTIHTIPSLPSHQVLHKYSLEGYLPSLPVIREGRGGEGGVGWDGSVRI